MLHLRLVVPADRANRALELLDHIPSVANLAYLRGAARRPRGDLILCDIAREDASVVVSDLRELGIDRDGAIALEEIESLVSAAGDRAERAARGLPGDAVVWEEVEARTSESTELSGSFCAFMALACLLATIAILLDSPILIIGAMIVGPDFGPIAGLCVALVQLRTGVARRSLRALAVGFPVGITAAFLFTLAIRALGATPDGFSTATSDSQQFTGFITHPDEFSFIVAVVAGCAGTLSLTSAKSAALIGVLVSVTTIPAAAYIGLAAAFGDWPEWLGAMLQLTVNLAGLTVAGIATLYVQRLIYIRRRRAHLDDTARAWAGLPLGRSERETLRRARTSGDS